MYIPLLSSTLPAPPHGNYAVGYATLRFPARVLHASALPLLKDGSPALKLTESVVAVYYPTVADSSRSSWNPFARGIPWLPDDKDEVHAGYDRFLQGRFGRFGWWIVSKLLGRVQMPFIPLASLAPPPQGTQFPLVVFSHGLAGTRNTYSQFCSAVASEGYVVVAVEHADGSGPAVVRNGQAVPFLKFMETVWPGRINIMPDAAAKTALTPAHVQMMELRAQQLDFRVREVYDAYACFTALLADKSLENVRVDDMDAARAASFVDQFRGRVDAQNLQLAGHSFGGAALLRLLTTAVPEGYAAMPAKHCVMLDPWIEPSLVAPKLPESTTPPPPTLVINSGYWTTTAMFADQFAACKDIGATIVSILGLAHQGFSDFALLTSRTIARGYLRTVHELTMASLTDSLDELEIMQPEADDGKPQITPGGKLVGKRGDVIVHTKWKAT